MEIKPAADAVWTSADGEQLEEVILTLVSSAREDVSIAPGSAACVGSTAFRRVESGVLASVKSAEIVFKRR